MSDPILHAYTYSNAIVGLGGSIGSGWQKTTTRGDGKTLIDKLDMFNHVTWHQDLGGHQFTYNYNVAGWLMSQTGSTGQNIAYTHYNNGFIQSIQDKVLGMYTYYEYDKNGNKIFEGYISLKNPANVSSGAKDYYQYATISYDAMNRMTQVADPKATITYEYDAVGNRRMVNSLYHDGVYGAQRTQTYWYKYDSMNRFTITMGSLSTGARGTTATDSSVSITQGAAGGSGVTLSYDLAGQRKQAINAIDGSTEAYSYTNDGYLAQTTLNDGRKTVRTNDLLGRVTTYQEYATNGTTVNYSKVSTYDKDNRDVKDVASGAEGTTTYTYAANGGELSQASNDGAGSGTTLVTSYTYQYWDDAKQSSIKAQPSNASAPGWQPGYSDLSYDVNGHLAVATDHTGNRNFTYISDAQGLILSRNEIAGGRVSRVHRYYYVDGHRVGDVGNEGSDRVDYVKAIAARGVDKKAYANWKPVASADFDQNYQPVSPSYPGATASNYVVKNGDTLQSIALQVWGDSAMWFLIADANGLTGAQPLVAGQNLTIPNKITNIHNNSSTLRPYNVGEVIGDTSPTIPTPPPPPPPPPQHRSHGGGGCGGLGGIVVAVVTIAVAVFAPELIPAISGFSPVAAAAASAAVGNIAGQITGNVLGVQHGFDFASLATSALTAGVTEGVLGGTVPKLGGGYSDLTPFGKALEGLGQYGAVAARAVVGNVIGQGVGNLTGQQSGFSWSSVAAAGVGAAAGTFVGAQVGTALGNAGFAISNSNITGAGIITTAAQGITASAASQLTQIALDGGGRLNWSSVAINGVSAAAGYIAGNWSDVKNGGLPRYSMAEAERMLSNGYKSAGNTGQPGKVLSTDTVNVTAAPWTAADKAELLAEDTANRLMQQNQMRYSTERLYRNNDQQALDGKYDRFSAISNAVKAGDYQRAWDEATYTASPSVRQRLINRVIPQPTAFAQRIDGMLASPIGASAYGISKSLGASEQFANIVGALGSGIDVVGGAVTGAGLVRARGISPVAGSIPNSEAIGPATLARLGNISKLGGLGGGTNSGIALTEQQAADLNMFNQRSAAPASGPIQFGQIGVSPEFSSAGSFKGASVSDVAEAILVGDISPNDIQINTIRWDGQNVAVNNRSLTALSKAGYVPTNIVDITDTISTDLSNPDNVFAVMQRLREMNFQPSPQIGVRPPGSTWQTPPAYFVKTPGE